MPIIDMPLEELKRYRGTNPRPADFDAYWEAALAELDRVDPDVEYRKSEFQAPYAECFDMFFTGVRGARIHAKYLRPAAGTAPRPAVIQFHGYSMSSGDWTDKLPYVAAGFSVFALDCRGQGGLSEDTGGVKGNTLEGHIIRGLDDEPENLLFRHIFLDAVELTHIAMATEENDPDRIGVFGASQGGGLTLACAALEPRIRKAAPVYPFLSDYKRVWEMDLAKDAYDELTWYFRRFDPRHERETEIFTTLGYIDVQHLAERIRAEVFMATGLADTICPPSTQFAVYNRIRSPKKMDIYPDYRHEWIPGFGDRTFRFMLELLEK